MRLLGAVAIVLALATGLSAQDSNPKLSPELANRSAVTVTFKNTTLANALEAVGVSSGITIQTTPDVNDAPAVTATFKNAKFVNVVEALLQTSGLTFKVVDEKTILVFRANK